MSINIAIGLLQFFQLLNGLKLQYVPGRESESLLFRAACCGLWGVEKNSLRPRPKRSELPTGIYSLPSSGSLRFGLASQAARKKNCRARAEVFCFYGEARICRGLAWHAWLGLAWLCFLSEAKLHQRKKFAEPTMYHMGTLVCIFCAEGIISIYIYIYTHTYTYVDIYTYIYMNIHVYIYMYTHDYISSTG